MFFTPTAPLTMNYRFSARTVTSLPFSRTQLLEEVINIRQHGSIEKVWCSAGHLFVLHQKGRQLVTFDTKPADLIQEVESSGILDVSAESSIIDVLFQPPDTIYIAESSGHLQQWTFRSDYTWTLVNQFNICNVAQAEVTSICLDTAHNVLYWCEKRVSSTTASVTHCICKRQLKQDDAVTKTTQLGSLVALVHNCPDSKVFPVGHGILMVTQGTAPQVSITLRLCTLTGKVEIYLGKHRHSLTDVTTHTAIDFKHMLLKCLHYLKQIRADAEVCSYVYNPSPQCLVNVLMDGRCRILSSSDTDTQEITLENFTRECLVDIFCTQGCLGFIYRDQIRFHCMKTGRYIGNITPPSDQCCRGRCLSLLGAAQAAYYTDTELYLVQCSSGNPTSDHELIDGGKFQTDAVRLAFLSKLKTDNKSKQMDKLREAWKQLAGRPPDTKLVSLVEPYLKEYWKLEDLLQAGYKNKESLPKFKPVVVKDEVDRILDPKSPLTRTSRQVQLLLLSQSHPQHVLTHLMSILDMSSDELSTAQLQRWKCILTQEVCDVPGSCDLAIPLFEQISHLLFNQNPSQLMTFLHRGQGASDQLVGVSAFIRKRQRIQVYERALQCIPSPDSSTDSETAVSVTVELLLTSETEGCVLRAVHCLVRHKDWSGAVSLLQKYADNSQQHELIFQVILNGLKQDKVLHQYSAQVFSLMPSCKSVKEPVKTEGGMEGQVCHVVCESETEVSVEDVKQHLLRLMEASQSTAPQLS